MKGGAAAWPLVDGCGLWQQVLRPRPATGAPAPALFLDRDGVVVEEVDYLHRAADVRVIAGAGEVIRGCNERHLPVVLVTNQAGIGRGLYGWREFARVQARLTTLLAKSAARLDMVLACAFHDRGLPPYGVADHPWRKPRPGMLLAAAEALNLDLARSWIVGDRISDLAAGKAAGLAGGLHVRGGHAGDDRALALDSGDYQVLRDESIAAARPLIGRMAGVGAAR